MKDPEKIWNRIENVFIDVESDDIKVKTITLPSKYLKILSYKPIQRPLHHGFFSYGLKSTAYVENPCSRKHAKIWDAKVIIGNRIKAN